MTDFQLLDSGWSNQFTAALQKTPSILRVVCPFIKLSAAQKLVKEYKNKPIEVITKFDLNCFDRGVSDLSALKFFLDSGATVRGIKGLHSKLYLFGNSTAIATSANLTEAALSRNHEFGFRSTNSAVIETCHAYFDKLWEKAGADLSEGDLSKWCEILNRNRGNFNKSTSLPDFGAKLNFDSPLVEEDFSPPIDQSSFIKFFGRSNLRASRDMDIGEMVAESGCHWACTYPTNKPPRQVKDGDIIFMARLVKDPNDLMIFGFATAREHNDDLDCASRSEIKKRPWKEKWSRYARVHSGVFLDANLGEGISMNEMMAKLQSDSFPSTVRNAANGGGNSDPRRSIMQKAHIQITPIAHQWVARRFAEILAQKGSLNLALPEFSEE